MDKDYHLIGLITYKDIIKIKSRPNACKDTRGSLRVGAAVGVTKDVIDRVSALVKSGVDVISIDTAHGHQKKVLDTAKLIKKHFPDMDLIAGNIATEEAAKDLAKSRSRCSKGGNRSGFYMHNEDNFTAIFMRDRQGPMHLLPWQAGTSPR